MSLDLFRDLPGSREPLRLAEGAWLLPGFAADCAGEIFDTLQAVLAAAGLRQMQTPGGYTMSVAMSCCGELGWTSDPQGYRYTRADPLTGRAWPAMPALFRDIAQGAADAAGYPGFVPDACLINRYQAGARLSPHQDRDEHDLAWPIVSLSLGLPARFQFGGARRSEPLRRIELASSDVVVWGGASRLAYHGVMPLLGGRHALTGDCRFNLSFRRAG